MIMNHYATVYLSRADEPAEAAEQVMRATAAVLLAAGQPAAQVYLTDGSAGSDSPGFVISTAELTEAEAAELWNAYPYNEATLKLWEHHGWEAVNGEDYA
jgi:hypothetical protein